MIIGLANYYVLEFRSAPIMPWDIYSIGTAASVAGNFSYKLEKQPILVIAGFIILIILSSFVNLEIKGSGKWKVKVYIIRAICAFACIGLMCSFTSMLHKDSTITKYKLYDKLFTPSVMSKRDGTAVAFLMELKYISVDKPDGYSAEAASKILASYEDVTEIETVSDNLPNIIVIMNEAFSDPAILGDFETNQDYMPFIHSIMNGDIDNTISGYMNVSVLGGNTANTEFEFLTGSSMAFLPQGSVAYQQYLKKEMPSLASHLKELGYQTIATHPYNSTGWNRNTAYPLLGFDTMYFIRDYESPIKIRKYVSDKSCYDKIIDIYETNDSSTPLFVFNVTMQNHSSYTDDFDNFTPDIEVVGSTSKVLNNYLSLIKISDEAVKYLVDYFSAVDDDTIIVMFGDHQPTNSVISNIWKLNGIDASNLSDEDEANRYKIPYFIWCNFDIKTQTLQDTSANYLACKILNTAGIPLNPYEAFLEDLSSEYPILTSIRTEDKDGKSHETKELMDALNDYAILQYNRLFGRK
jgi:phosphoglycerol transferase MdoB-like AlkP superfamily enzyme